MFVSFISVSHKISALLYHFLLSQVDQEDLLDKGVEFDLSVLVVTYSPSEEVESGSDAGSLPTMTFFFPILTKFHNKCMQLMAVTN